MAMINVNQSGDRSYVGGGTNNKATSLSNFQKSQQQRQAINNIKTSMNTTTPAPVKTSSGGSSYSAPDTSYYNDLIQQMMSQNAAARDSALAAIMSNLEAVKGTYNNQIRSVGKEYDDLVDQNEVAKDRARRRLRENQANRGQLDSGLGRQELLNMNLGYDSKTSDLKNSKTSAINEIMSLIAQAEAEANNNKANINNQYANALASLQAQLR